MEEKVEKRILALLVRLLEENMIRTAVLETIVKQVVGEKEWNKQAESALYIAQGY